MATHASECPKLPWMINFFSTDEGRVPKHQLQAVYNDNRTDYLTKLNFESEPPRKRLTKIICTLGPKSFNVTDIERMVFAGMDIVRIKLPFFTLPECETTILNVRQACTNYSSKIGSVFRVAIALDLRGPEIRTGAFKDVGVQRITFEEGEETFLTADPAYQEHVTKEMIYVDYQAFNTLEPGDKIKINNSVHLSAVQVVGSIMKCIIEHAGSIGNRSEVRIENSIVSVPTIAEKEINFAIEHNIDMLMLSDVRDPSLIQEVRKLLGEEGKHIMLIAKVEDMNGLKNIDQITDEADAIFISRSDLENSVRPEKLFIMQKQIVAVCNKKGKPVIVAPQMLESMQHSAEPTKAEIMDVTNSILDGADCIVLSRETATGEYNLEAITTLDKLCKEAESAVHQRQVFLDLTRENPWPFEPIYALSISTVETSMKANAACIITLTTSGRTAQMVARYRPRCPIVAITRHGFVARKLRLFRGVEPIHFVRKPLYNWNQDVERRIQFGITYGKYYKFIKAGDTIIVLSGSRPGTGFTNTLSIYYASDFDAIDKESLDASATY